MRGARFDSGDCDNPKRPFRLYRFGQLHGQKMRAKFLTAL
jgi:hypothetical protein